MDDDVISIFTYENKEGATPAPFNLTTLISVADRLFFPKKCALEKIAEGGFHKVRSNLSPELWHRSIFVGFYRFIM